jgi:hypothetical protein
MCLSKRNSETYNTSNCFNFSKASLGNIYPIFEIDPSAADNIDTDAMMHELSSQFSVSSKISRPPEMVQKIRQQRQEQQQAEQQIGQASAATDIYAKLSHAQQAGTLAEGRQ